MQNHQNRNSGAPDLKKISALLLLASIASATVSHAQEIQSVEVKSRIIENFLIGSDQNQFGPLEFVGGLELTSASSDFGAISGIALENDQSVFIAVADTGFWMTGQITRGVNNQPDGLANVSMQEIARKSGEPISEKWQADAEGITINGQDILVSFERAHRITHYNRQASAFPKFEIEYAPPVPLYELRDNRGFEGIAFAPNAEPLNGGLIGISEKSLDKNKNIMGFVKTGDSSFEFSLKRKDEFDVTDLGFLPDGNLIVLERRFNVADGIGMRLRHINVSDIKKGATVDGETLLEADFQYQIDNMEGMSITVDDDGIPRLTLVSDDNHSILQRNLLLEFRLTGTLAN